MKENNLQPITEAQALEHLKDKSRKMVGTTMGDFQANGGRFIAKAIYHAFDDGSVLAQLFSGDFEVRRGFRIIQPIEG